MSDDTLALRVLPGNQNHHLWDNNGTWFIHYTVHRPDYTKARIRQSLGTKSLDAARRLRDRHLSALGSENHPLDNARDLGTASI